MRSELKMMLIACVVASAMAAHAQCIGGGTAPPAICLGGVVVKNLPADTKTIAPIELAHNAISNMLPVYPEVALHSKTGGIVRAAVLVDKTGHVEKILATYGPDPLIPASTQAIIQWTFKPYLLNGDAIPVASAVYLDFKSGAKGSSPQVDVIPGMARISGGVIAGALLSKAGPIYPVMAKQRHSGSVVLYAIIGTDGKIADLKAISGPIDLQQAAVEAVRQWTYKPYLLNGQVTAVETTITINFN